MFEQPLSPRHPHQQHTHHLDHDHDRLDICQVHANIEVGSNTVVTGGDGAKYRGREYPWGTGRHSSSS